MTRESLDQASAQINAVHNRSVCVGLVIGFVGVVAWLGIDFRRKAEELIVAGAVLTYSTGSDGQPDTAGRSG